MKQTMDMTQQCGAIYWEVGIVGQPHISVKYGLEKQISRLNDQSLTNESFNSLMIYKHQTIHFKSAN